MALTRPKIWGIDTTTSFSTDPIMVLHQGAVSPNTDVGFLFNRANGLVSNVALYWSEEANTFVTGFTANSGQTYSNIVTTGYANLTIGSLLSINGNIYLNGVKGTAGQYITATSSGTAWTSSAYTGGYIPNQSTFGANLVANSATISTSTTTGALVVVGGAGVTGNVTAANVFATGVFIGSGSAISGLFWSANNTPVSTGGGGATFTGGYIPNQSTFGANLVANSATISTSTTTGALVVVGGAGISGNLSIGGNITATNVITAGSYINSGIGTTGNLTVGGNVLAGNLVTTAGLFWSNGTVFSSGITYTASSIAPYGPKTGDIWYNTTTNVIYTYVDDGASSFWLDLEGPNLASSANVVTVNVTSTTDSVSTTTGALTVAGGVGIGKSLYIALTGDVSANIGTLYSGNISTQANLGAYQTWANATSVITQANIDSYYQYANANAASQTASINTFNANLGAYQLYSNANAATQHTHITNIITTANANTAAYLPTYTGLLGGTLTTAAQPNINSVGVLNTLTTAGNVVINGNLSVTGNITYTGNVTSVQVTGNSGQFFGDINGFGALYAGIGSGYLLEPQIITQYSANYNGYAGVNHQNINPGSQASSDVFLTADNGTSLDGYVDIGIASSTYNYTGYDIIKPNDAYVYVAGNTTVGGGNLIVGTYQGKDIIFVTNGLMPNNEVMRITAANVVNIPSTVPSNSYTTGALTVAGGVGILGNLYTGGNISINNATPDAELSIFAAGQTLAYSIVGTSDTAGTEIHITAANSSVSRITQDTFGTGTYSAFTGRSARGNTLTPTQTLSSDILTQFTGRGFSNGSQGFGTTSTGLVSVTAAGAFTDTSRPTNVVIYTTSVGNITPTAAATFSSNSLTVAGNIVTTDGVFWSNGAVFSTGTSGGGSGTTETTTTVSTNTTLSSAATFIFATNTITLTLPSAVGNIGAKYTIKNAGTGTITVVGTSGQTIDNNSNMVMAYRYSSMGVISNGSNWSLF